MQSEMKTNFLPLLTVLIVSLLGFACQKENKTANVNAVPPANQKTPTMTDYPVGNAKSPSEAYRMLFAAVKSQDPAKIKLMMSKNSLGLAEMAAAQQKKSIEEVLRNGFTETTFADTMPQMRDERIKGGYGAVEVWSENSKKWEDIPFVLEDGSWKAAFGDLFTGKFQSPGKGQAIIEQELANAKNPNLVPLNPGANINGNFRTGQRVDKSKAK